MTARRAIVVGCGPSMRGWEPPEDATLFGVNDCERHLSARARRLQHLVVIDLPSSFEPLPHRPEKGRVEAILSTRAETIWLPLDSKWNFGTRVMPFDQVAINVFDADSRLAYGDLVELDGTHPAGYWRVPFHSTPVAAAAIAYRMGFKSIGLIGTDYTGEVWRPRLPAVRESWARMRRSLEKRGCELVNLSTGESEIGPEHTGIPTTAFENC